MRKLYFLFLCFVLLAIGQASAQTRQVRGVVTDSVGNPLSNVSVQVRNTNVGTRTNETGQFTLAVPAGSNVLVLSSIGYESQEVTIDNRENVSVTLSTARQTAMQEVVVTALGTRRSERALGYSVTKVDPGALTQKSEPDLLKSLQGKAAGVDIRTSQGTPGAATRIQIRGNNTFNQLGSQPLIVVDGIPYSNDQVTTSSQTSGGSAYGSGFSNLDPNDIASLNILKGATAAALYGSRAANGVVVITTKSGNPGRAKKGMEVTYSSSASMEKIANLPEYQNEYGTGANFSFSPASNGSWGAPFGSGRTLGLDSVQNFSTYQNAYPELFPASGKIAYRAFPNNVRNLFQTGSVFENSVGFNGGDEKSSVALTASHLTQKGYVVNSTYNRANVGLGGQTRLNIGLNVRGNFSYSRSTQKGGYFGENQVDGAASMFARSLFLGRNWDTELPYQDKAGNSLTWNGGNQFDHPIWSALNNVATTNEERSVANLHADFTILPWMRVDYTIGSNVNTLTRREITEISSRAAEGAGRIVLDNYRKQEIESNLLLTFTPRLLNDLTIRFVVGNSVNQRTTTRQIATGNKFITRGIYTLGNTSQQIFGPVVNGVPNPSFGDLYQRNRLMGVFGDLTLGYKNFAFVEFTGRNDWSSTLPLANRSYFYPSVSGSLVFTDALNLQSDILSFGKVRAGWAKVGNDAPPYLLENIYSLGANFLGQTTAGVPNTAYDPGLTPEFSKELELGTNLSFWKRKIDVDFTWYKKTTTNLIGSISLPSSSGFGLYNTNFGQITNRGIEIDVTLKPIQTRSFSWNIRAAFTKNENTVDKLAEGIERIPLRDVFNDFGAYLEPGMPYGYLRGTKVMRDSATGAILINPATGGMIVSPELGYLGNPNPDFKLGITNAFSFKGVFLSALFDMTKGGVINSVTLESLLGRGVTLDTKDRMSNWIIPGVYGDPTTGKAILDGGKLIPNQTSITTNDLYFSPNTSNGSTFAINSASEWTTYDATVYRLREVTLGYDFPKELFKRLPIGSATLTFTGRNLWFLAPNFPRYTNFDPEVSSFGATAVQGIELSAAPTTKRYGVN
ncbi:MAG: SusC/RagA family TonB-linked outer membrane protein, partial [Bacteroidota bacterium]|nr:SusC/RagA family TonB-linked outer membrane protein [Bacteroidota bacterium]